MVRVIVSEHVAARNGYFRWRVRVRTVRVRTNDRRCRPSDVLQADATRCGGFSGLLAVDGLCQSTMTPLSTHCAPHLHLHAAMACKQLRHIEYFFDHFAIERMLFDGAADPENGDLSPDPSRPGIGLELRRADAERYAL